VCSPAGGVAASASGGSSPHAATRAPDTALHVHGTNAGLSACGIEALGCSRQLRGQVLERLCRCGGHQAWPGCPPRMKLVTVSEAHEVVVSRILKVQAPEPDLESGWEGVRAAHGVPLGRHLGANHHRDYW
jgi:hypothetical protein